jgi:hypothetical protein
MTSVQIMKAEAFEHTPAELEDFAAELTEAAFPVALRHGAGPDWLARKLELWGAMTRTVNEWARHGARHLPH